MYGVFGTKEVRSLSIVEKSFFKIAIDRGPYRRLGLANCQSINGKNGR